MPPPPLDPVPLLQRYAAGFFPMVDDSDPVHPIFFWDRCPIRAILPVNAQAAARARRIARRSAARFTIRYTTSVEQVLRHLRRARDHSWVQGPVLDIYRTLHAANVLRTIEAWTVIPASPRRRVPASATPRPRLAGALLGILLPGVFIAETMYGLVPDASKICLCQLIQDCHAAGIDFIDVQTPHDANAQTPGGSPGLNPSPPTSQPACGSPPPAATPHPCIRLGEQHLPHSAFLALLRTTLARHFSPGSGVPALRDWITLAQKEMDTTPTETSHPESHSADPRRFLHLPRP